MPNIVSRPSETNFNQDKYRGTGFTAIPYDFIKTNFDVPITELSEQARRHALQDARAGFKLLFEIVKAHAKAIGQHDKKVDMFPHCQLALDLCRGRGKCRVDLPGDLSPEPELNWLGSPRESDEEKERGLNDLWTLTWIRQAQDDIVRRDYNPELKELPTDLELQETAKRHWGPDDLPTKKFLKVTQREYLFNMLCNKCGDKEHRSRDCPNEYKKCQYDHLSIKQGEHAVDFCLELHAMCSLCQIRGHVRDLHQQDDCPDRVILESKFLQNAPFGKYTSVVYLHLSHDPHLKKKLLTYQLKWGLQRDSTRQLRRSNSSSSLLARRKLRPQSPRTRMHATDHPRSSSEKER